MSAAKIAESVATDFGFSVFPCRDDKRPTCPHGCKDASRSAARIVELWRRHPGPLIGVACGHARNLAVLDIDAGHLEARDWWLLHRGRLLPTRAHRSRSGGLHLLLRYREGLRCSISRIARGIDVKAEGGAAIWWPAVGLPALCEGPIAPWQQWLVDPAFPPAPPSLPERPAVVLTGDRARRYALGALRRAVERLASAGEGARNAALNREAYSLTRLSRDGVLGASEIADALAFAGLSAGLGARETEATIASALRAGGAS
ncbi:MAG: bifunctional DNA primase/polymerase [Acetobacteraceae bacterium]